MTCDGSTSCTCEAHVAARKALFHPIHSRKDKPITPTLIPPDQARAMWLGVRDDASEMLAKANAEIQILDDLAAVQG